MSATTDSLEINAFLISKKDDSAQIGVRALIDSGAQINVISSTFLRSYPLSTVNLWRPISVTNVDGTPNRLGKVTQKTVQLLRIGNHQESIELHVVDLPDVDIILGHPWLAKHNPVVDWQAQSLSFDSCPTSCSTIAHSDDTPEPDYSLRAYASKSQQLAEQVYVDDTRPLEEMIPTRYHKYLDVFNEAKSSRLPAHTVYDHAIEIPDNFNPPRPKAYRMTPDEEVALDKFLKENLDKGYIRPSKSPLVSPFFFVKKKDGKLRPVQDYRVLNSVTTPDRYPLPDASAIIDKLRGKTWFTKFDVRWGYNNVRIREGDEWKAAFICPKGSFEPLVMFFGLTNSPPTFQRMMNEIFRDELEKGDLFIFMDDEGIATSGSLEDHERYVEKILKYHHDNDLYLNPKKCLFSTQRMEYLGLIITPDHVAMDPVKIDGVLEWPTPTKVKEVQAFLGFANFYRRFIRGYSQIAQPLFGLTRKNHDWDWDESCEKAFQSLKAAFTTAPVLSLPDPSAPFRLETDASDYATGAILSQRQNDGDWHPIAYLSQAMAPAERNYEIHDKELLAIIRALEEWRHLFLGSPHTLEIITDHKNLEYFTTKKQLNRRQARWSLLLADYNYSLIYRPGKTQKADGLSRRADHKEGVENDNSDRILIPIERFSSLSINALTGQVIDEGDRELRQRIKDSNVHDDVVQIAMDTILSNGPRTITKGLQDWNIEDGIVLHRGRIYIPKDDDLRRDLLKLFHDSPVAGHPGKHRTLELLSQDYWWPNMSRFVDNYVKGCAVCQATKPHNHPARIPLMPNETPDRLYGVLTTDFVTGVPTCQGFDAISVWVDRLSKRAFIRPTTKTIDSNGTADLFIKEIFPHTGLPDALISDRGTQFASRAFKGFLQKLRIDSALSTAYHPQSDGQTERMNQELEQYLRVFCDLHQDDWVDLLPLAEFSHNINKSSATGHSPFEMISGSNPRAFPSALPSVSTHSVEERLAHQQNVLKEARASMALAAQRMRDAAGNWRSNNPEYQEGQKVWLDGKNLRLQVPSVKLASRRHGPFEIEEVMGPVTYRLAIPRTWKRIHPVFHVSLLTPYVETDAHGPNYTFPPPDAEGDDPPEYEVESIVQSRLTRNKRGVQYRVRWKGYPPSSDEWINASELPTAREAIDDFHAKYPQALGPRVRLLGIPGEDSPKEGVLSWDDVVRETDVVRKENLSWDSVVREAEVNGRTRKDPDDWWKDMEG